MLTLKLVGVKCLLAEHSLTPASTSALVFFFSFFFFFMYLVYECRIREKVPKQTLDLIGKVGLLATVRKSGSQPETATQLNLLYI